ncbi:carboxypeptidase-like regulatory domain-containing protein [Mucilaginibacter sp. dw_454]|uniref:carboxypeptidase-like regulatory domain-containing protein n=1 Tax=Mucilaginibacter sp. dw_454 TaxID=2720079 RepID=UPI001BD41DC2|nr:carboxypeptidase-like regulatory domain-containing protein [Mucilaginibacter sp. dw_454]
MTTKPLLLTLFSICFAMLVKAQVFIPITGTVVDEKGDLVKGATAFISGSQLTTITDNKGKFYFNSLTAGSYQVIVKMMGYAIFDRNIVIQNKPVDVNVALIIKPIMLNAVTIGPGDSWDSYYNLFKGQFLGTSRFADGCEITNPKILSFNYNKSKGILTAEADDFILIENRRLGYHIKYLLRDFQFTINSNTAIFDGDAIFEEMVGSKSTHEAWARNRYDAYKGSLMHFLRSIYANNALKQGFIANSLVKGFLKAEDDKDVPFITIDTRPVHFDSLLTVLDTTFVAFKTSQLYVTYDPKKAASLKPGDNKPHEKDIPLDGKGIEATMVKLPFKQAIIDRKGNYTNYRAFFIHGDMATKRVGDKLPFEYEPPAK